MDLGTKLELIKSATTIVSETEMVLQTSDEAKNLVLTAAKFLTSQFDEALLENGSKRVSS